MKAIIPVAGAGTKLRPLTYTQPKALIPLAGKTILSVIVDGLVEAGVDEFVFVTGYLGEKIQRYVDKTYPHLAHTFVHQADRRGTGHAIWCTRDAVRSDEPVLIVLGDTVADYNIRDVLASPHSLIGVRKVDDPRSFGVAELAQASDRVMRMVEKPLIPKSNMAMVGIYFIRETARLFSALESHLQTRPGADEDEGEYHLTAALQAMLETGVRFDAFRVANWFDCGKKETLLATNAILLKQQMDEGTLSETGEATPQGSPEAIRNPKSEIRNQEAVIIPPVSIAEGCKISASIIGPNVTIGENTRVQSSIIRDSIIGSYAELNEVVLHHSIIGSDAFVRGLSQSLNIGDNTEIDLG